MIEAAETLDPATLEDTCCVHIERQHDQSYLGEQNPIALAALFVRNDNQNRCIITSDQAAMRSLVAEHKNDDPVAAFETIAKTLDLDIINLSSPMPLSPVHIPKPWGQEIWYTGIEERGVSEIQGVPLAWLLDLFGNLLSGNTDAPILLKILDPLPEENLGDLYFELHEKKTEVYVVTRIDEQAWEGGVGGIRYGFNQDRMQEFSSREEFHEAYLDAVEEYKAVRDQIDAGDSNEHLNETEERLRHAMYEFTAMHPLHVGDVVRVKPFVPHSLQHGVRVVEFQTPHYERHILSFGQKVLTQDGWDTVEAVSMARDDPADIDTATNTGTEVIANFDEFHVQRIILDPGDSSTLDNTRYKLAIGVSGEVEIEGYSLAPEAACYVPQGNTTTIKNKGDKQGCLLIAYERS